MSLSHYTSEVPTGYKVTTQGCCFFVVAPHLFTLFSVFFSRLTSLVFISRTGTNFSNKLSESILIMIRFELDLLYPLMILEPRQEHLILTSSIKQTPSKSSNIMIQDHACNRIQVGLNTFACCTYTLQNLTRFKYPPQLRYPL